MNITQKIALGLGIALNFSAVSFAGVPEEGVVEHVPDQISYQAVLADPVSGQRYRDGVYTLDVRIWNSETRKTGCLWGAKYTVAVRDGFFSLMLGDPAAADFEPADGAMPQFAKDELWKALWGENEEDADRFLGITPHEDERCVPLNVLSEISPRQRLTAAPFAHRAHRAHYAESSREDFTVPGKLTVAGSATFSGGLSAPSAGATQNLGSIQASATDVLVGGVTVPLATSPNIYAVGYLLTFQSVGDLLLGSTQSDTVFSVQRNLTARGDGSLVAAAAVNTIGGTGKTTLKGGRVVLQSKDIRYEQGAVGVTVSGGSEFVVRSPQTEIEGTGGVTFRGAEAGVYSVNGSRFLAMNGANALGQGTLKWEQDGTADQPIIHKTVSCPVSKNDHGQRFPLSNWIDQAYLERYRWFVAGWRTTSRRPASAVRVEDNSQLLVWKHRSYCGEANTFEVVLIGFAKDWCQGL